MRYFAWEHRHHESTWLCRCHALAETLPLLLLVLVVTPLATALLLLALDSLEIAEIVDAEPQRSRCKKRRYHPAPPCTEMGLLCTVFVQPPKAKVSLESRKQNSMFDSLDVGNSTVLYAEVMDASRGDGRMKVSRLKRAAKTR